MIMKKLAVYTALFTDKPDYLYGDIIDYKHDKDNVDYILEEISEKCISVIGFLHYFTLS